MNDETPGGFPNMNAFVQMWSDFTTQMMKSGMAMTPDKSPPENDARNALGHV